MKYGSLICHGDFPRDAVHKKKKNLSTNAGDMGSTPGPGRSHAAEQLSPCVSTTEPKLQSLWVATTESTVTNTEP